MTDREPPLGLTRRRVLLATGSTALGVGLLATTVSGQPTYTRYARAETPDDGGAGHVTVAWRETYNGDVLETQGNDAAANETVTNASAILDVDAAPQYVPDRSGPVATLSNVLPGDSGALAVGLHVDSLPESESSVELWCRLRLTSNAEHGVVEPESAAGDDDSDAGELGDALAVTLWEDTGSGPTSIGACNGSREPVEPVLSDGSLVDAAASLEDGHRVDDACLEAGETRCLGLSWRLPDETGNVVQSDAVTFDLSFVAVSCDHGNPF